MCSTLSCYLAMMFLAHPVGMPVVVFAFGFFFGLLAIAAAQSRAAAVLLRRAQAVRHG